MMKLDWTCAKILALEAKIIQAWSWGPSMQMKRAWDELQLIWRTKVHKTGWKNSTLVGFLLVHKFYMGDILGLRFRVIFNYNNSFQYYLSWDTKL